MRIFILKASANHAKLKIENSEIIVDHTDCKGCYMVEVKLFQDMNLFFREIGESRLRIKLDALDLPAERKEVLLEVLMLRKNLHTFTRLDIQLYVLKNLFPDFYDQIKINIHSYSSNELYEYDPPKNGQNIIKHGISFGEVVSFSSQFGTLSVPCPDERDGSRVVIFSDLDLGKNGENLSLPCNGFANKNKVYTLSVAQRLDIRFRFISSRVMSNTRVYKGVKDALKGIYNKEPEKNKEFVERCVEILEQNLFS